MEETSDGILVKRSFRKFTAPQFRKKLPDLSISQTSFDFKSEDRKERPITQEETLNNAIHDADDPERVRKGRARAPCRPPRPLPR